MTDWRAVGLGFAVMVVAGVLSVPFPIIGQIGTGLVGGFAAGYVAGGGPGRGAWHGLLAGSIAGIAVSAFLALFGSLVGLAGGGPLGGFLGGAGVFVVGAVLTLLFALDSALAGALGALLAD